MTDGDTLRLRDPDGAVENVRLVGIDTPEVYPVRECFGDEAEAELLRLAPVGEALRVAPDVDPRDDPADAWRSAASSPTEYARGRY